MKQYQIVFENTQTGYSAYVPDLPGCIATGTTKAMAKKNIHEAMLFHLDGLHSEELPVNVSIAQSPAFAFHA